MVEFSVPEVNFSKLGTMLKLGSEKKNCDTRY